MWQLQEYIYIIGAIVFGSVVHSLVKYRLAIVDPAISYSFVDFVTLTLIASFSGLITGLLASLFFTTQVPIIIFSAIGAFWGIEGLSKISTTLQDVMLGMIKKK